MYPTVSSGPYMPAIFMTSSAASGVPMLRDDVRRMDGQTKDDVLDRQPELGRLKQGVVRKQVRLYHERHVDVLCAEFPCEGMYRISEHSACVETEHVQAYAFKLSNPCSSPANAMSSTSVWNVRPSSLMRCEQGDGAGTVVVATGCLRLRR